MRSWEINTDWWSDYNVAETNTGYWPTPSYSEPVATPTPTPTPEEQLTEEQTNLLDKLSSILSNFFDAGQVRDLVANVIKPGLQQGLNEFEIMDALRATDTYKTAFPEWQQRIDNGFAAMDEYQILQYRDAAKQIAQQWGGFELSNEEIGSFIASNRSLAELESTLQTYEKFKLYGQDVVDALSLELGRPVGDDEAFLMLSDDYSTPELDAAYRNAVYKGYTKTLNLRAPTDEEVALLNERNVSIDEAVKGYQTLASNLPTYDRLYALDQAISSDEETPFDSMGDLFKTIFAQDPETQLKLSQSMAREVARFTGGGGIAGMGKGFLTPDQR